jgi:deoxynucleoside triphosphate triphosphohydrolase SAMHD1
VIDNQICYGIKEVQNIFDVCQARYKLHKKVYNHKTGEYVHLLHISNLAFANTCFPLLFQNVS